MHKPATQVWRATVATVVYSEMVETALTGGTAARPDGSAMAGTVALESTGEGAAMAGKAGFIKGMAAPAGGAELRSLSAERAATVVVAETSVLVPTLVGAG